SSPWPAEPSVLRNQEQDFVTGPDRAPDRAADFALADATTVGHRNLDRAQFLPRGLDLHFHGPAEVRVAHLQIAEPLVADRSKRSEVRITDPEQQPHQHTRQSVPEHALRRHRTGFRLPEEPRAEYEI